MKKEKIWNRSYVILFLVNLIVNTSFYMISTALSKHLVHLGMNVTTAGTIVSAMAFASMLCRPFTGWVSDRIRRKRLLAFSLTVNFICVLGYGFTSTAAVYLVLRALHGMSFSLTTTVTMVLVSEFTPKDRLGAGMGYFGLAQTLAVAVGPGIALALYGMVGSRNMFFVASGCVLLSLCSVFLLPETELQEKKDAGTVKLGLNQFIAREALIYSVITIAVSSINAIENGYIALYGEQFGLRNVGWYFTVSAVTLLFSRTFCSRLSDVIGFSKTLYGSVVCIVAALISLSLAGTFSVQVMFLMGAVLKAIGVGTIQPALQAATIQSVEPSRRGAATSTFYIGTDLGQSSAPVIAGKLIDTAGYPVMLRLYILPLIIVCILYGIRRGIKHTSHQKS